MQLDWTYRKRWEPVSVASWLIPWYWKAFPPFPKGKSVVWNIFHLSGWLQLNKIQTMQCHRAQGNLIDSYPIHHLNINSLHQQCTESPDALQLFVYNILAPPSPWRGASIARNEVATTIMFTPNGTHHGNILPCLQSMVPKSWNSLPNRTIAVPSPEGLQQHKKAAHYHFLKGNYK